MRSVGIDGKASLGSGRRSAPRIAPTAQGGRPTERRGEGPPMNGRAGAQRPVRRPCARLGSHPRASAGPLLRLADRPTRYARGDRRRAVATPPAADTPRVESPRQSKEGRRRCVGEGPCAGIDDAWLRRRRRPTPDASYRVDRPRRPPRGRVRDEGPGACAGDRRARLRSPPAADTRRIARRRPSREVAVSIAVPAARCGRPPASAAPRGSRRRRSSSA